MKFFVRIVLMSLTAASLLATDSTQVAITNGPHMQFEEETFDFGTIEQGKVVEHVFHFRNVGLDTLHISNVRSS
jgi:hypothetical protein